MSRSFVSRITWAGIKVVLLAVCLYVSLKAIESVILSSLAVEGARHLPGSQPARSGPWHIVPILVLIGAQLGAGLIMERHFRLDSQSTSRVKRLGLFTGIFVVVTFAAVLLIIARG